MNRAISAITISIVLIAAAILVSSPQVSSQDSAIRDYDWIVEAQTEELKDYLNFPGSNLKPIFKAAVTYKSLDPKAHAQPVKYEDLFYRSCDAIGCRRYHTFDITSGDGVAIRISTKSQPAKPEEACAAANIIVRLLLDSYLNGNSVPSVLLPYPIFNQVISDLHRENFYSAGEAPPDQPVFSSIILELRSEPGGLRQTMNYTGQTSSN